MIEAIEETVPVYRYENLESLPKCQLTEILSVVVEVACLES